MRLILTRALRLRPKAFRNGFEEKEGKSKVPLRQVHKAKRNTDLELIRRRAIRAAFQTQGEGKVKQAHNPYHALTTLTTQRRLIEPSEWDIDAGTDDTSTTKLETHSTPAMGNAKAPTGNTATDNPSGKCPFPSLNRQPTYCVNEGNRTPSTQTTTKEPNEIHQHQ